MINGGAISVLSTRAWARVFALVGDASLIGRTVGVKDTFRAAAFVGVADIIGKASAGTGAVLLPTNCIGTTG